jgi:hypothetical protein
LYVFILSIASVANPLARATNAPRRAGAATTAITDESPTIHARPTPVANARRARVAIAISFTASTPDARALELTNPEDAVVVVVVVSTLARRRATDARPLASARVTTRRAVRRNMLPRGARSGAFRFESVVYRVVLRVASRTEVARIASHMSAYEDAIATTIRALSRVLDGKRCSTTNLQGVWREDKVSSDSLCALLRGLGCHACVSARDAIRTELRIACDEDGKGMTITDKTTFSSANATSVRFGEDAVEKTTRGGRKKFRLSGDVVDGGRTSLITCELFQRGPGWYTEQRRFIDEKTGKLARAERFEETWGAGCRR